jgi:hypothetical protein
MIITGMTAALKIAVRPATEYQAAIAEMVIATNMISDPNNIECIYRIVD